MRHRTCCKFHAFSFFLRTVIIFLFILKVNFYKLLSKISYLSFKSYSFLQICHSWFYQQFLILKRNKERTSNFRLSISKITLCHIMLSVIPVSSRLKLIKEPWKKFWDIFWRTFWQKPSVSMWIIFWVMHIRIVTESKILLYVCL